LDGVQSALGEGSWTAEWTAEDRGQLTLKLPSQVIGEIATKSRVPVAWVLDKAVTFKVFADATAPTTLHVDTTGIFARPFEGIQIYKDSGAAGVPSVWAGLKTDSEKMAEATKEATAFYKYVEKNIKRHGMTSLYAAKYYFNEKFLDDPKNKMSRIWHTIREMPTFKAAPGAKDGAVALYSMALASPMKILGLDLAEYKDKGVRVSIRHALDTDSPSYDFFLENHIDEKSLALFNPQKFPSQRKLAEKFASSAMSYAAALAAGNPEVTQKNFGKALEGGIVHKVAKLFKPCDAEAGSKSWMVHDQTWGCQGSNPGRTVWRKL